MAIKQLGSAPSRITDVTPKSYVDILQLQSYDVRRYINAGETLDTTGTNDTSTIIQRAIDTVSAQTTYNSPVTLWVPNGKYKLTTELVPKNGVIIRGESRSGVTFLPYGTACGFKKIASLASPVTDFGLYNLTIDGINQTFGSYQTGYKGIFVQFMLRPFFKDVTIKNTWGTGFGVDFLQDYVFENCLADGNGRGITATGASRDTALGGSGFGIGTGAYEFEQGTIVNCVAINNGVHGIFFEQQTSATIGQAPVQSKGMRVENCYCAGNWYGYRDAGVQYAIATGNTFVKNLKAGAAIDATGLSGTAGVHGELSNNIIAENGAGQAVTTVTGGVVIGNAPLGSYTIRANRIYGNTGMGIRGFLISTTTYVGDGISIIDNRIHANTRAGIFFGYASNHDPIVDLTIARNNIYGNATDGTTTIPDAIRIEAGTTRLRVLNNVTSGPGYGLYLGTSTSRTHTDLVAFGNDFTKSTTGTISDSQTSAGVTYTQNIGDATTGYTDGQAKDAAAASIAAGTHSGISFAYNSSTKALSATVSGGGGGGSAGPGTILSYYALASSVNPATTSTTADLDGVVLTAVVPASGKIKISLSGVMFISASSSTTGTQLQVIDNVTSAVLGAYQTVSTSTAKIPSVVNWVVTGLTPGSTVSAKVQYKNTNPASSTYTIQGGVLEIIQY